jgi:hypothetical protein
VWIRLYGASRSGKTEILRGIAKHKDSAEMEVITPASIRGGLDEGHRLLNRIKGQLVITKDFASMLTSKREARNEVFGLLRNAKDGKIVSDFGTKEGYLPQDVNFDWIIATTPVFAQYKQMEDLLGARYIDLSWKTGDREEMAHQALQNNTVLDTEIRPKIAETIAYIIDFAKDKQKQFPVELSDEQKKTIADWADLTALLRSPVARDRQHRVTFPPAAEVGTELAQGFEKISKGLVLLGIDDIYPYIARLSEDCIPFDRRPIIKQLLEGTVISNASKEYTLDDLRLLKVVQKDNLGYSLQPNLKKRLSVLASYWSIDD